ncbi:MAG: ATPase [Bacteroidetes bacterium]|nr:MAG: ATPase [Bacteroidota bacterium]
MAVDVVTEIVIERPVEEVAAYAANPAHAPQWYVNIKSITWKTPPPLERGSLLAFKARFLGRELAYVYEVVEWIPGKKMVMRTADGPFPMETTYEWEALGPAKTHMRLRNRGNPSGFSSLMAPLMVPAMRRANRKDLGLLKKLLEKGNN